MFCTSRLNVFFVGFDFARDISMSVWSDLLQILQIPLLKAFNPREGNRLISLFQLLSPSSLRVCSEKERESIVSSLDGLRSAIKLSCALGKKQSWFKNNYQPISFQWKFFSTLIGCCRFAKLLEGCDNSSGRSMHSWSLFTWQLTAIRLVVLHLSCYTGSILLSLELRWRQFTTAHLSAALHGHCAGCCFDCRKKIDEVLGCCVQVEL